MAAVKKCGRSMFWDYILTDYIFDYIFMGFAFIIYYIFVILY